MLNSVLNFFIFGIMFCICLFSALCLGSCSSPTQDKSGHQVITNIIDSILNSSQITIIHIDITDGGHLSKTPEGVTANANITLNLKCDYKCGNSFPTIVKAFTENTFYEKSCDDDYSTVLRLHDGGNYRNVFIGWYGHCITVDETSYMATTSLLNGIIGGFPDYIDYQKTYGMTPDAVINEFELMKTRKVYEPNKVKLSAQ